MRKVLFAICISLISVSVSAEVRSQQEAKSVAERFFNGGSATRSAYSGLTLVWNGLTRAEVGDAPFYIYNNAGGGFIIVSGDTGARTILGYSRTGSFSINGMPEQLSGWLEEYRGQIGLVRESEAAPEIRVPENEPLQYAVVKCLNTANWGQSAPFNSVYPKVDGELPVTCCVATAMAEVMYYHKWPEKGTGTLPSYSYTYNGTTITHPGHALGYAYDWANMKSSYSSYTTAQGKAVSTLMYDCSVMVKANLKPGASSASTSSVPAAIKKYMDYDAAAIYSKRSSFTTQQWVSKLKNEIDHNRPVVYAGHGSGGHAFVVDGYDTNDNFRVNWGWKGSSNGYFAIDAFKPGTHDYTETQGAVFNMMPNQASLGKCYLTLYVGTAKDSVVFTGVQLSTTDFKVGVPFNARIGIINYKTDASKPYDGLVAVVHTDADENIKEIISEEISSFTGLSVNSWMRKDPVQCVIKEEIEMGDKIMYAYKPFGSDTWFLLDEDLKGNGAVLYVTIADTKTIEECTNVKYDKSTGNIVITTKKGVDFLLYRTSDNSEVSTGWTLDGSKYTLHTAKLPLGEYKLNLSKGTESVDLLFEW